jgi:hypothetical protein
MNDIFVDRSGARTGKSQSLVTGFLGRRMRWGIRASLFLAVVLAVGCKAAKDPSGDVPTGVGITASPNPVPAGPEKGTTRVSWNTGDGSAGQVYVSRDGKPEQLFSQGPKGSEEAAWIQAGSTYEFRLYAGKEHARLLASVQVRRD